MKRIFVKHGNPFLIYIFWFLFHLFRNYGIISRRITFEAKFPYMGKNAQIWKSRTRLEKFRKKYFFVLPEASYLYTSNKPLTTIWSCCKLKLYQIYHFEPRMPKYGNLAQTTKFSKQFRFFLLCQKRLTYTLPTSP